VKGMNEILELVNKLDTDDISLCSRCMGRLFGKLGHNLDNLRRGEMIQILYLISKSLAKLDSSSAEKHDQSQVTNPQFQEIRDMLEAFAFDSSYVQVISKILMSIKGTNQEYDNADLLNDSEDTKKIEQETNEQSNEQSNEQLDKQLKEFISQNELKEPINKSITDYNVNSHEDCEICSGLFDELPEFSELVCEATVKYEFNDFLIGCKLDIDLVTKEEELWSKYGFTHPEPLKGEFNRELGKLVKSKIGKEVNFNTPDLTIIVDTRYDNITLQISSLFIYGRYRKLVRSLPQTRWPCKACWGSGCKKCEGTGKIYPTSVEEEIAQKVMEATNGKAHYFHGMGREDIGVRMLGNGRPFILEITEPVVRTIDLDQISQEINEYAKGKVEVLALKFTNHRAVRDLKAAKPDKTYIVTVNFSNMMEMGKLKEVINTLSGRDIQQRTPTRVAHRRADLVRNRTVRNMELNKLISKGEGAEIEITGESGLYIKELITGDSGRTVPNLASELGTECVVQELDVINIDD
jgi:tRNA pseudouridine synthase 10